MTPNTVSTPRSPRLVTVIVGSDISELRNAPLRARVTRSRSRAIRVLERKFVRVANSRRDQAAAADGDRRADMDAGPRLKPFGGEEPVELRGLAERTRNRLEQQC